MNSEYFRNNIDLIYVMSVMGGGNYIDLGHYIKEYDGYGPLGGRLTQVVTDNSGRLQARTMTVSSVLGCGHLVTSTAAISGFCYVCGRVCCPHCLRICEISGITACRRHSVIYDGVVISTRAQKGLWKLKARRLAKQKKDLIVARKKHPKI